MRAAAPEAAHGTEPGGASEGQLMPRPRKRQTGLPSYCYRDRNGRLYMLHPADRKDDGSLKLRRVTYADLDALLAAWRTTWGETARDGGLGEG